MYDTSGACTASFGIVIVAWARNRQQEASPPSQNCGSLTGLD